VKLRASGKRIEKGKADATPRTFPAAKANDPKIPLILVFSQIVWNNSRALKKTPGAWAVILLGKGAARLVRTHAYHRLAVSKGWRSEGVLSSGGELYHSCNITGDGRE